MWGRNEPNPLERILAMLMSYITAEKTDVYPGERRMLHEVLEDDENIEYWMGGRWARPTNSIPSPRLQQERR